MNEAMLNNLSEAEVFRIARESDDPLVAKLLEGFCDPAYEEDMERRIGNLKEELDDLATEAEEKGSHISELESFVCKLCEALADHDDEHPLLADPLATESGYEP